MARPRRRRRWLVVIVSLSGAWIGYQALRAATAKPAPVVDYAALLTERVGNGQAPGENGWPHVEAALVTFDRARTAAVDDGLAADRDALESLVVGLLDGESVERGRVALARLEAGGYVAALDALVTCPRAVRPIGSGPLLLGAAPRLTPTVDLTRAVAASLRLALETGDTDRASADLRRLLALARAIGHQPSLLEWMLGHLCVGLALDTVRLAMVEHPDRLDAPACRALLDVIERDARLPSAAHALGNEHLVVRDSIQWCFSDDGHGDGRLDMQRMSTWAAGGGTPPSPAQRTLSTFSGLIVAGRRDTTTVVDTYFERLIEQAALTPSARERDPFDGRAYLQALSARHVFARLLPALDGVVRRADATPTLLAGTRLMLALRIHAADHGALPTTLDELVPAVLDELPVDPMHGGPFRFRLLEGDPAGRPYLLYSTGRDDTDDGGAPDAARRALTEPGATGVDWIVNAPRENE